MKYLALVVILSVSVYGQPETARRPVTTDQLEIGFTNQTRSVVQTSRGGGYYITTTNADVPPATAGWYVNGTKVLYDYTVMVDGRPLKRSDVTRTSVLPHQLIREYKNGTKETVTLIDHSNALLIELDSVPGKMIYVRPYLNDIRDTSEIVMRVQLGELYIGKKNLDVHSTDDFPSLWLGLLLSPGTTFSYVFYEQSRDEHGYSPASMHSSGQSSQYLIEFFVSANPKKLVDLGVNTMRYFADSVYDRRVRMDQMMNRSYLRTNRDDLTRSLNWAKVSLDALSLSTPPGGVWSGVPFGDIVGARDIFSSVPGIVLGTGKLKDLVPVFREFAATQDTDPASGSYGCIADRLGDSREYTDADATPLFVAALGMYVQYSGDSLFAAEMLPYVRRSIEGALRYRTDSLLFLKHGDDGTWMGIPRGNRADDLQGYWQKQLQTGISLCDDLRIDSLQQEAGRWRDAAATLEANFRKYFIDSTGVSIADYLSPTGKRDQVVRPNQLMDAGILNNSLLYQSIFAKLTPMLVSPYGVLTRSVLDPGFHTFHYDRQLYAPQQGVYEGVIHTWLAGEWTTQAVKFGLPDSAMIVTRNMSNTILHGAIPGTLPEMIDAARLDGDSLVRASGYMSSARGLAEYLRSWYEGYLGVSVDHMGSHLTLYPNLPASVTDVDFNVPVGGSSVAVQYRKLNDQLTVGLSSPPGTPVLGVVLLAPVTKNATPLRRAEFDLNADKPLKLAITKEGINRIGPGQQERVKVSEVTTGFDRRVLKNVHLASVTGSNIQNQAGAGISLLTLHDVKHPPQAASVLADIADSSFNDSLLGIGGEGWLGDLKRGILDITHFTVRVDSAYMYFTITYRDLCYPTTHPEYGFDRTITAVAIDRNGEVSDGSSTVGRNAHCTFSNFSFSEIIYLGSGLRIEDGRGNVLAEYYPVPDDDHQPLGDYIDKSVSFSIPVQITGKPSVNWRYAVVTGVRDDGGGDIGTFRTVSREMASGTHQKQEMMKGNIFDLVRVPSGK